jgi:hypothetical protein
MTEHPHSLLNPAALPVNPETCKPIYPHEYIRVNTIFEVAHNHGLRTALSSATDRGVVPAGASAFSGRPA